MPSIKVSNPTSGSLDIVEKIIFKNDTPNILIITSFKLINLSGLSQDVAVNINPDGQAYGNYVIISLPPDWSYFEKDLYIHPLGEIRASGFGINYCILYVTR
jgi:hypothetical protein